MNRLPELVEGNCRWSERMRREDPEAFERMPSAQRPAYLGIGCSDSRVPASQKVDLPPGEVFVHRNLANLVPHTGLNVRFVLGYAMDGRGMRHVVCYRVATAGE